MRLLSASTRRTSLVQSRIVHRRAFTASHNPSQQAHTQAQTAAAAAASSSHIPKGQQTTLDSPDQQPVSKASHQHYQKQQQQPPQPLAMSKKLIPPNPADVMVIRDLTPSITIFSVPFSRVGYFKIGGRATLVRLTSGSLAIFSPVALTDAVRAKIAEKGGDLAYIVAPDIEHHIFLSEYKAAYPSAKLVGPDGLPQKRAAAAAAATGKNPDPMINPADEFAVVFAAGPAKRDTRVGADFDADFDYEFVDAHPNKELVFLYRPERVLIQADLLFNLPPREQYSRAPEAERESVVSSPGLANRLFACLQSTEGDVSWARRFQWYLISGRDRAGFNESIRRIDGWDFDTVIPCHGDTMQGDGKERFRKVFAWHLAAAAAAAEEKR